MRRSIIVYILIASVLHSCNNSNDNTQDIPRGQSAADSQHIEKIPASGTPSGTSRGLNDNSPEILANIDRFLVSLPEFQPPASPDGGIRNATILVRNDIPGITVQKALVEVSILLTDGKEYRTDYYNVINIEPGESKSFKIPVSARGQNITSRIVKLKSTELTNGEMILVGDRYVPQ